MGLTPENDSLEETFVMLALRRKRLSDLHRTVAIVRGLNGDKEGSFEALKKHAGLMLPQLEVETKHAETNMVSAFQAFKDVKLEMAVSDNGRLMMRQDECQKD